MPNYVQASPAIHHMKQLQALITEGDDKISKGADETMSSGQQVIMYGHDNNDFRPVKLSSSGKIITSPEHAQAITQNGTMAEQRTLINGHHNGHLRTVKVSDDGTLASKDSTSWVSSIALASTAIGSLSSLDVDIDMGANLHIPDDISLFITNSAKENTNYSLYQSYDGQNWFQGAYSYPVNFGENTILGIKLNFYAPLVRYYRLNIQNAGQGSSNYSVTVGHYS